MICFRVTDELFGFFTKLTALHTHKKKITYITHISESFNFKEKLAVILGILKIISFLPLKGFWYGEKCYAKH